MSFVRGLIPSLVSKSIKSRTHLQLIHTETAPNDVVNAVCDSLRTGRNWDTLTRKFGSVNLDELVVKQVLLELKEPVDAKRALGFFHLSAHGRFQQHGLQSYCILIHILVRAGLNLDARALLESVYAKLRMFEIGFDVCCYWDEHGFSLDLSSFNIRFMLFKNLIKKLKERVDILDRIHGKRCSPSVIVNTSLVLRVLEEGRIEASMVLLKRMLHKNMVLDAIAYSLIVNAKVKIGNLRSAYEVFEEMLKRGFLPNSFIYTLFIGVHCKEGGIEEANCMMQEMENMGLKPYGDTYIFLIEGKNGEIREVLKLYYEMEYKSMSPGLPIFQSLIKSLCQCGKLEEAEKYLGIMKDHSLVPSECLYKTLIAGYIAKGNRERTLFLYNEMVSKGLRPNCPYFFYDGIHDLDG
ncbi:hypothetical protein FEM48_Zijuj04G0170900 [Ziziphus jujuba var. spinosa]|uniref:Uncharacterized protein n=1 Tax=Ziziphus jujuba var. spinosa TaxID=714518 RepID=A0A978VL38_ZIZJJ|nr:hypothetical protein FEM48_Zijuj04G0170900 [Ziziphus jujuba var. spinosa]